MLGRRSGTTSSTTCAWTRRGRSSPWKPRITTCDRQANHVGVVKRWNQLEDVVSDSSTSIIRIVITFATAFIILVLMSWKLAAVLFAPILFIVPAVYWFSTRVQRKYRKQRESTGDIHAVLENLISGISVVQAYNAENVGSDRVAAESGSYRDQAMGGPAKTEIASSP